MQSEPFHTPGNTSALCEAALLFALQAKCLKTCAKCEFEGLSLPAIEQAAWKNSATAGMVSAAKWRVFPISTSYSKTMLCLSWNVK